MLYLAYGGADLLKGYTGLVTIIKLKLFLDSCFRCMLMFFTIADEHWLRVSCEKEQNFGVGENDQTVLLSNDQTQDELQKVTLKEIYWLCDGTNVYRETTKRDE